MVVGCRAGIWGLQCFCPFVPQGEFRVAEHRVTMKQLKRALEQGRVRESSAQAPLVSSDQCIKSCTKTR